MSKLVNITNEEHLLLQLCFLDLNNEQISRIHHLIGIISDWTNFCILANAHGISALVYHNLVTNKLTQDIPEKATAFLHEAFIQSLSRNTFNIKILSEILTLLNENNIKTVLIKGMSLELSVYGNSGLRQMSDIDLFISREECLNARKILMQAGFSSFPIKSSFHKPLLMYIGKHLPSLTKDGVSIDIHHELFHYKNHALTKKLYDTSIQIKTGNEKAYLPQNQLFFLYLVKHLHSHEINNESQLRLYTDLLVLINKHYDEIINPALFDCADQAGISEILARKLGILRDIWNVPFPGWTKIYIDKWLDSETISEFLFFLKSPKGNPSFNKKHGYKNIITNIPGVHRKLLYILGDVFPSISFMKKRYRCFDSLRILFYYPHRLGKLFWLFRK